MEDVVYAASKEIPRINYDQNIFSQASERDLRSTLAVHEGFHVKRCSPIPTSPPSGRCMLVFVCDIFGGSEMGQLEIVAINRPGCDLLQSGVEMDVNSCAQTHRQETPFPRGVSHRHPHRPEAIQVA